MSSVSLSVAMLVFLSVKHRGPQLAAQSVRADTFVRVCWPGFWGQTWGAVTTLDCWPISWDTTEGAGIISRENSWCSHSSWSKFHRYSLQCQSKMFAVVYLTRWCFVLKGSWDNLFIFSLSNWFWDVFNRHTFCTDLNIYRPQTKFGARLYFQKRVSRILSTGGAWSLGGVLPGCASRGVCLVETPLDGYCCGRYASYWNAFLLVINSNGTI